ncbi:hypothetical protein P7C70_g4047, partial [Phenoliferia sp. Uapishka_3]
MACTVFSALSETPSRVLRRIQDLEDQQDDLPSLPDLPSFEDSNGSISHSNDSYNNTPANPITPPQSPSSAQTNNILPASTPYTSTPAPSNNSGPYQRSQSTIAPSTGNTTVGAGARGKKGRSLSQHLARRELPSFEADASAIGRHDSLEEERENMIVFSGSGGEESERDTAAATRPVESVQEEEEDQEEQSQAGSEDDRTTSSTKERKLNAFFDGDSDVPTHPDPHDYSLPLSGEDSGVPTSERAKRVAAAAATARISTRRPAIKRKSSAAAVPLPSSPLPDNDELSSSGENESQSRPSKSVDFDLPSFASPLRDLNNAPRDSTYGSPGVGRHASPQPSPHATDHLGIQPFTPGTQRSSPSSNSFNQQSAFYATPIAEKTDADRRKEHVLQTLRSTAKPRFVLGTPHPARKSPLSATPRPGAEDGESVASDGTSNDLTTFHKGNTSLPSGGVTEKSTRFNGAKLNAYLHSLNSHLTEENQSLVQTLGESNRELKRLKKDKHKLEERVKEMSIMGSSVAPSGDETEDPKEEASRVERLERQLEGLVESHQGINGIKRQLGEELGNPQDQIRVGELEAQVERMEQALREKEEEVNQLREQVVEARDSGSPQADLVAELQREVFGLKDELGEVAAERDANLEEIERLRVLADSAEREITGLNQRVDGLLSDMEEKDLEVEEANANLQEQEANFAEKMQTLEEELSRVMEGQEEQLAGARADLERRKIEDDQSRREEAKKLEEARRTIAELESTLGEVREERDRLERQVAEAGSEADKESTERVRQLREQVVSLQSTIHEKDDEISHLQTEMDEFERKVDELDADESEAKRQLDERSESLRQIEEALDESAQQLLQNEEEMENLRAALASERSVVSSLSAQISELSRHKSKAKSPLGNEAYNHATDPIITSLEEDLDDANAEIAELKARLAAADQASVEIKDIEIKTLESHKHDLEERVTSLRQQVLSTPSKTPDKSMLFRSVIGVQTPKTPGHFMSNLSAWSPGSTAGDATISPLLAQIQEFELTIERLQSQLSDANEDIDNKLNKLEAAGSGTISLARQLARARERIAQLEAELDRLLGDHGTLHRVRTRLSAVNCPDCHTTFDANKDIQLRIDKSTRGVSLAESQADQGPRVSESLREALAGVNAKLSELQVENEVLQDAASRSKVLAADKSSLTRQHAALQKVIDRASIRSFLSAEQILQDFDKARVEIVGLEGDLRTERDRVKTLSNEATLTSRAKSSLESRLSSAETELRNVKRDLASAGAPDALERLRREKSDLVTERADLLQRLSAASEKFSRADRELITSRASQNNLQSQLDGHLLDIKQLRASLETKDAAHRVLTDERVDILRGVAGLQSDLNRVRQDAISLGLDLSAVRRERDAIGARQADGAEVAKLQEELIRLRKKLSVFEQKVAEHVCPSDANALVEMKARHSDEAKGLLTMIRYLKVRVTREATFRNDLSYQKDYLSVIVRQKQSSIDSTLTTLAQLGLPYRAPPNARTKLSFKGAAQAMIAVARMNILSRKWKSQSVPKTKLRTQAYPEARGRPFIP